MNYFILKDCRFRQSTTLFEFSKGDEVHVGYRGLTERGIDTLIRNGLAGEEAPAKRGRPVKTKEHAPLETKIVETEEKAEVSIEKMNKDELEEYALAQFGIDLDKRESLSSLRKQVKKLQEGDK